MVKSKPSTAYSVRATIRRTSPRTGNRRWDEHLDELEAGIGTPANLTRAESVTFDASGLKEAQLEIILQENPAHDDIHTWVRSVDDILTFEEAVDEDGVGPGDSWTPDYTGEDALAALASGEITVYSSYRIGDGTWVTPSRMEAESYAGSGQIHSMTVRLEDVAWVDGLQGQYAKVRKVK